jgi:hypothetical protein
MNDFVLALSTDMFLIDHKWRTCDSMHERAVQIDAPLEHRTIALRQRLASATKDLA